MWLFFFQTYSVPQRVLVPCYQRRIVSEKDLCWHWHRLVAGQQSTELTGERRREPSHPSPLALSFGAHHHNVPCFFVCLLLISHLFSPLSKNRIYGSLTPLCLHPACVQRHNRSPKRESEPVSTLQWQDIPVSINRMTVCLQYLVFSLLETINDFESIALVCHCNKTMPLCNSIPNSPHRHPPQCLSLSPAAEAIPSFLLSLTFVQGYSFSPWLETFLK